MEPGGRGRLPKECWKGTAGKAGPLPLPLLAQSCSTKCASWCVPALCLVLCSAPASNPYPDTKAEGERRGRGSLQMQDSIN
jgi:hypothetical protein